MVVSATRVTVGSTLLIEGAEFAVGSDFMIYIGYGTEYQYVVTGTVASDGTIAHDLTVPELPAGSYVVFIEDNENNVASGTFDVIPKVELDKTRVNISEELAVTGTGFTADDNLTVKFNDNIVSSGTIDHKGSFSTVFSIPDTGHGIHKISVSDQIHTLSNTIFIIQSLVVDKNSGIVGSQITITAKGFDPEKHAIVEFDDIHVADIDTDSKGDLHYNTEIPESTSGEHTLTVSDGLNVANAPITTLPSVYVAPSHGPASSMVQVTGQGFAANKLITTVLGDIHVATTATDERGSFNTEFVVPPLPSGTYEITASDEVNSVTSAFNVTTAITLSASEGFVGMQLAIEGSGFVNGITIMYDDEVLASINALSDGTFSTNVVVPESKNGHHAITFLAINNSIPVTFTVESDPPPVPKTLLPTSSETTVSDPTFEWWPVSDPSGVTYRLEIATDPSFLNVILRRHGLREAKYSLSTDERLSPNDEKPYYWRVKAVDRAQNESEWTEPYSFYVKAFPSWAIYMIIALVSVVVTIAVIQRRTKGKADK